MHADVAQAECQWLTEYVAVLHERVAVEQRACQRLIHNVAVTEAQLGGWQQLLTDLLPFIDWSQMSDKYAQRLQARYDTLVAHTHQPLPEGTQNGTVDADRFAG